MNQFRLRLFFISVLLVACGVLIISRLFTIQVIDSKRYVERSRDQTQQRKMVTGKRGSIKDRHGLILATSMDNPISVKSEFLGDQKIKSKETAVRRVYPLGDIAGSVLGYIGKDGYGLGGVELSFDKYLRGEDGWDILQKDGRNHQYKKIGLPSKQPRDGYDCYLTIDSYIQKIAQVVLKQTVATSKAHGGMCIVMEPQSGKILAMASEPSFNPNVPSAYSLALRNNGCISSVYEPGSTFKAITASVALQEKIFKEDDLLYGNNGVFEIYNQVIRDHSAYGYLTFTKALAYSSNVCFAKISNEIGNERFYNYTLDFGFGSKTGIRLPGEEVGIVHPIKNWSGRTRVTMAMGQELSVTLLQLALAYAAVANNGVLVTPQIYEKVIDAKGQVIVTDEYKPVRRVLSEQNSERLRRMLQQVVEIGTGSNAAIEGIEVAGKTGTSQKPDSGSYSRNKSWSSFIGFAPVDDPLLLCAVVIDEPSVGEMGGVVAAPAFKKILLQTINHPELDYASKFLKREITPLKKNKTNDTKTMPFICGKDKSVVIALLEASKIRYKIKGEGNNVVQQFPLSGSIVSNTDTVVVSCEISSLALDNKSVIPNCIGKDLRDAINMISIEGIRPYAVGGGIVTHQKPLAGTLIKPAEVCTLYCSFEG